MGPFYGFFVYKDLRKVTSKTRCFGKGPIQVTVAEFLYSTMFLRADDHLAYNEGKKAAERIDRAYIVPLPCYAAGWINDPRYGIRDQEVSTEDHKRTANATYRQT